MAKRKQKKPTPEELLGEEWLVEYMRRMAYDGLTVEQMTASINEWITAVICYGCYLIDEQVNDPQWGEMIQEAKTKANFDLEKFPKVNPNRQHGIN